MTAQQQARIDAFEEQRQIRGDRTHSYEIEQAPTYAPTGSILVRFPRNAMVVEPSGRMWRLDA